MSRASRSVTVISLAGWKPGGDDDVALCCILSGKVTIIPFDMEDKNLTCKHTVWIKPTLWKY
ncbi:hypothetical protein KFK09_028810 [Dendrobium nobile]|uniref:Uncharacterized protein n=1 Tax=Dendrobium nobile TaxID=94219 RepID=A0A8T3A4D2_DENNO|nr:hypothetical protein KFK09_028810 [Dendrobium nobile]